jgi:hypothetical protein
MAIAAAPPGPRISLLRSLIYRPGRDPLAFFMNLACRAHHPPRS